MHLDLDDEIPFDPPAFNPVWTTREGIEMEMSDITDTHLLNIIKMLKRDLDKVQSAFDQMDGHETGGFVAYDHEAQCARKTENIALFEEEARKRGVLPANS